MKNIKVLVSMAAAGMLLMAQPTFAAGTGVMMNDAPVITAGAGNTQGNGGPGMVAGNMAPGNTADGPGHSGAPVGDEGTILSKVIVAGSGTAGDAAGTENVPGQVGSGAETPAVELTPVGEVVPAEEAEPTGRHIDPSRPMVALTFDDGPQTSVGNRIMDCLAQYGGKATFFMVGDRVASHKAEVQRMAAEGHEVANHTMNHKYLQKLGAAEIQAQVNRANDAIEAVSGVRPTIMRLPGGNHNATVRANTHMPMIQWNIDTLDWKTKNVDKTVEAVLNHVKDGDIVLMHELYNQSGEAAVRIIPELVNRGYQLVTVREMAAAKGYALEAGKLYSSFR